MRKGKRLPPMAAWMLCAAAYLLLAAASPALSAGLEPTDSGAPSAILMFPQGEKPTPAAAGMPPVAFNHLIHEKWMEKAEKDCVVCHHTGEPVSCATCHTVAGSKDGNFITLHQAMHTPRVKPRKEDTPSSCVSCHATQETRQECAGCHERLVSGKARTRSTWCAVCHMPSPAIPPQQLAQGLAGTMETDVNEELATALALARKQTSYWSPLSAPYKVRIDTLVNQYEPCTFNHRQHVVTLLDRIKDNKLAGAFHTQPATLCMTCHHRSPASETPPGCVNCHTPEIEPARPGKPNLKAAFHLQCMNCHTDMKVARPQNTSCETCHKIRPAGSQGNKAEGL